MYPILFPFGTDGWTLHIPSKNESHKKFITLAQWVRFYLMARLNRVNYLHHANKLYQQIIVNEWAKSEMQQMTWMKINQHSIRADLYKGVQDSLCAGDIANSGASILASSFTQGNRWYTKAFMNAMALVRVFGKPTFFITMTMDVNCPEVKACLKHGQTPYNCPDVVCRIFQLKRLKLMKMLSTDGIFGKCIARCGVIEFQKRGAPHLHLMIWIADFDATPENIDNIICAEIPRDPSASKREEEFTEEDKKAQRYYDTVKKCMMHYPW